LSPQESKANVEGYAKEAIALALQSRWQEAIASNKSILELFPEDVETHNRLGRALMEVGEYAAARKAYGRALELDPRNNIAKKNLDRLSHLKKKARKGDPHKVVVDIFVEETGKARVVKLINLASKEVLAQMAPGEQVILQAEGQRLVGKSGRGEYVGEVEPKYGARLARLISLGNEYVAAINSLGKNYEVKVIIREVYQHPDLAGHPSFPIREKEGFRPYVRESLLRNRLEDEELGEEVDEIAEVEREGFTVADFYDASSADERSKSWPE
jgi:tetratricopeptide (TPR) repeat protein